MIHYIEADEIYPKLIAERIPIADVRTPGEYAFSHIPGAVSLPLFSNEEHAEVGTLYKQKSKLHAVDCGLGFVGPKMQHLAREGRRIAYKETIALYCARGGMRSSSLAWLLNTAGLEVYLIKGGYRAYKEWSRALLAAPRNYHVLGGPTGSGKTEVLLELQKLGAQVIDLEELARHRGSAFGHMEADRSQPSSAQVTNQIAELLYYLDPIKPIWLESESKTIGKVALPEEFYAQIATGNYFRYQLSRQARLERILREYATLPREYLVDSFHKIEKRLGPVAYRDALQAVEEGDYRLAADLAMVYYDKAYHRSGSATWTAPIAEINAEDDNPAEVARQLMALTSQ